MRTKTERVPWTPAIADNLYVLDDNLAAGVVFR